MSEQNTREIAMLNARMGLLEHKIKEIRLKEEDIDLIVNKVCAKIEQRIYSDVGRGILKLAWRGILIAIVVCAAWLHLLDGVGNLFKHL